MTNINSINISETFPDAVATKYWHLLEDGRVQCDLCPRFCKMHDKSGDSTWCHHCGTLLIERNWFTTVDTAKHIMDKTIEIGEGASLSFIDSHFHSQSGGIKVLSSARIKVGKHGYYFSDFSLTTGHVGKLNLD